jgi:hypothetical protein
MPERFEVVDRAVWSMQDDDVEWAAVELVEHCRQRLAQAEQLLGVQMGFGPGAACGDTIHIRTVRSIVTLMADAYRQFWLPERLDLPVIGLSLPLWHQVQWRGFFMVELHDLLDNPAFVRNVLISTLNRDTDVAMAAEYAVLLLLRLRYGMPVPAYLWKVRLRSKDGAEMPPVKKGEPAKPHFWL